jgi:hypothetical protein
MEVLVFCLNHGCQQRNAPEWRKVRNHTLAGELFLAIVNNR